MKNAIQLIFLILPVAAAASVLVWDHDGGQWFDDPEGRGKVGTEEAVLRALGRNGVTDVVKLSVLPADLAPYEAVFVLCGFWPHDGSLTYTQQNVLIAYLQAGGNLYLEGTEVAARYGDTPLFALTGARFADDGRELSLGNVNVAEGVGPWAGRSWNYFSYRKDKPDGYVDELEAAGGTVVIRSRRAGNRTNARVIRYQGGGEGNPTYRVIVSSLIFGALQNGEHTKADLMELYLEYFGLVRRDGRAGEATPASFGRIKALFR